MELEHLLRYVVERGASDLHLKHGSVPLIRLRGHLEPLAENLPSLTADYLENLAHKLMDGRQRKIFEDEMEVDIAYAIRGAGRFRINIFKQRGSISMVIRFIPMEIPSIRQLRLPAVLESIASYERGLVLITGVTGSGKSTTMASLISYINNNFAKHIVTIEDPIEYFLRDAKGTVTQREVGTDTLSFDKALRAALRQDPDVILIGEMRDKHTIETALMAAETGHLVISTLHTKDSKESINRMLSFFEPEQHTHIRNLLASNLRAVISQRLARGKLENAFLPVVEVMINNQRVTQMILDPKRTGSIHDAIEDSQNIGMQSFEQNLQQLVTEGKITKEEAMKHTNNQADFELRMSGIKPKGGAEWGAFHGGEATSTAHYSAWDDVPALEIDKNYENEDIEGKKRDSAFSKTRRKK